jgi:hypothetical protein
LRGTDRCNDGIRRVCRIECFSPVSAKTLCFSGDRIPVPEIPIIFAVRFSGQFFFFGLRRRAFISGPYILRQV